MKLRVGFEKERRGVLIRFWWSWTEFAYIVIGLRGLKAEIEFPSDWHERRMGWVRLGFGLVTVACAFPWPWVVPDEHQCSGPTYGFYFCEDMLRVMWGKDTGKRGDPHKAFWMPWSWRHRQHEVLGEPEVFSYSYVLKSGEVQVRTATIKPERRLWTRPWLPWKRESRYIDVTFSDEVGERSGSWKGGCIGCSYDMLYGETPRATLRRMERQRVF